MRVRRMPPPRIGVVVVKAGRPAVSRVAVTRAQFILTEVQDAVRPFCRAGRKRKHDHCAENR